MWEVCIMAVALLPCLKRDWLLQAQNEAATSGQLIMKQEEEMDELQGRLNSQIAELQETQRQEITDLHNKHQAYIAEVYNISLKIQGTVDSFVTLGVIHRLPLSPINSKWALLDYSWLQTPCCIVCHTLFFSLLMLDTPTRTNCNQWIYNRHIWRSLGLFD